MMAKIQIIGGAQNVNGVYYVDVITEFGKHSKMLAQVNLINALYDANLSENLIDNVIMPLVEIYASQREAENQID